MGQSRPPFKSAGPAMDQTIAIVMPAWKAQATIIPAVSSVLAQTWPHWQLWLVADDGFDYAAFLAAAGIRDDRLNFLSSGGIGTGASAARNVGLDAIGTPYAAVLDADDRLKPEKLARCLAALGEHGIVSAALDVMTEDFRHLRHVADGPDLVLTAGTHKWVNLSGDTMIAWDRRRAEGRYDPALPNMTDLDFLLQLFRTAETSMHLGTPLHDYIKRASSMSNGSSVAASMIAAKTTIMRRLEAGAYGLPAAEVEGVMAFLAVSLEAERRYEAALAARPGLLFEDHLEPMLAEARR